MGCSKGWDGGKWGEGLGGGLGALWGGRGKRAGVEVE